LSIDVPLGVEPLSTLSPSLLFSAPPPEAYESLFAGPGGLTGWDALHNAQSMYASSAVDPFSHLKKGSFTAAAPQPMAHSVPTEDHFSSMASVDDEDSMDMDSVPTSTKEKNSKSGNTKRKRAPPSEETLAMRRKKHNEIEIRRRQRLNDNFEELQRLVHYDKKEKDKDSVLRTVIDRLKEYERKLAEMESLHQHKQSWALQRAPLAVPPPVSMFTSKVNHSKIFSNNDMPMCVASLNGRMLDANDRFCDILGYTRDEIKQIPCMQLTHPDDLPKLFKHLNALLNNSITSFSSVKRMLSRNRQYVHFNNTVWIVKEKGEPKYIMGVFIPVKIDPPLEPHELPYLHLPRTLSCEAPASASSPTDAHSPSSIVTSPSAFGPLTPSHQ
jgi:PAS domain S-box-containing protein